MPTISLNFFSVSPILLNGEQVKIPYVSAEGVLYYLIASGHGSKEIISSLFWGDSSEEMAKKSLRNAVYTLRKVFSKDLIASCARDMLKISDTFKIESDLLWLDGTATIKEEQAEAFCSFYRQDFMAAFSMRETELFSQWLQDMQQSYRSRYIKKLEKSAEAFEKQERYDAACLLYEKLLWLDSYEERSYRKLIELLLRMNRRQEAIKVYSRLETILKEELFIRPSEELRQIVEGSIVQQRATLRNPFFGREQELSEIDRLYKRFMEKGKPESFFITGEPGVGKSALIKHWVNGLDDGCTKLFINNYRAERDFPYKLWHSVCGQINMLVETNKLQLSEEMKQSIRTLYPEDQSEWAQPDVTGSMTQMDYFILRIIMKLSQEKPVLLIIDDFQWVDEKSLSLLSLVLMANDRVMLAGTTRSDQEEGFTRLRHLIRKKRGLHLIALERFTLSDTQGFLDSLAPELASRYELIYHESEGNAFFIMEAVHNLLSGLDVDMLTPNTYDFISARISRLGKSPLAIANLMAVMENDMSLRLLQIVSGSEGAALVDAIDTLLDQGILREFFDTRGNVCYSFTHQKLRDHIYSEISMSKRILLHGKIAKGLEELYTDSAEAYLSTRQLIYHYALAHDFYRVLMLRIERLERIVKLRYEMFRLDVVRPSWAIVFLDDAIDNADQELSEIRALLKDPKVNCRREDRLIAWLRFAYVYARQCYFKGRDEEGAASMKEMLHYARDLHKEEYLADAYLRMIFLSTDEYQLEQTEKYVALAAALKSVADNPRLRAMVRHYDAVLRFRLGDGAEAKRLLRENIEKLEALPVDYDVDAEIALDYYYLSTVEIAAGEYEAALISLRTSRRHYHGKDWDASTAMIHINYGIIFYMQGDYENALKQLRESERFYLQTPFLENRGVLFTYLTRTCAALHQEKEARRYAAICAEIVSGLKIETEKELIYALLKEYH